MTGSGNDHGGYLPFGEMLQLYNISRGGLAILYEICDSVKHLNGNFIYDRTQTMVAKRDERTAGSQNNRATAARNPRGDRVFPLQGVEITLFNSAHGAGINKATVHTGPYADELAKSHGATAVTKGTDIYFRQGAYEPDTEEGRKTIAHELTHVEQHREKRITKNADREELEKEAEKAEAAETGEELRELVTLTGKKQYLTRWEQDEYVFGAVDLSADWLEEQSIILHEREYIKILVAIEEKLTDSLSMFPHPVTPADWRMDRLFRKKLAERFGVFITSW